MSWMLPTSALNAMVVEVLNPAAEAVTVTLWTVESLSVVWAAPDGLVSIVPEPTLAEPFTLKVTGTSARAWLDEFRTVAVSVSCWPA